MILRNFISLRAFTVYMENSLRFEILHRSHVNADNEVTSHRSEFYPEVKSQTGLSSLQISYKRALKEKISNVIKKINKLLVTFHVSFVIKNMNLAKKRCPAWVGGSVNCAKSNITLKLALIAKKVKNRKRQTQIIRQILEKVIIIVQMNHSLQ